MGEKTDMNKANEIGTMFRRLAEIAERTGCAVILIGHLNKAAGEQSAYYDIAAQCDKETMLQCHYSPDCMDKRNRYMVDHADYILAVWNGCPSGTGNTVRYAHKKGKSIIVINPDSLDVTRE